MKTIEQPHGTNANVDERMDENINETSSSNLQHNTHTSLEIDSSQAATSTIKQSLDEKKNESSTTVIKSGETWSHSGTTNSINETTPKKNPISSRPSFATPQSKEGGRDGGDTSSLAALTTSSATASGSPVIPPTPDRKSTRLNSSHSIASRMPSSA